MSVAIIILAAGKSARMGVPKQAIEINGKSLIKSTIDTALSVDSTVVTVVLGANKESFVGSLEGMPITLIDNPNWEKGMGTSIKMGLVGSYMVDKALSGVLILTSDMPFVDKSLLSMILSQAQSDKYDIIACKYGNTGGVPAFFSRKLFNDILDLPDEEGAKKLILDNKKTTYWIDFPKGNIDLDTPTDLENYLTTHQLRSN